MVPNPPYGLSAAIKHIGSRTYAHVFWMVSSPGDRGYELYRRKQGDAYFAKVAVVPAHNPSTDGANWMDYIAGAKEGDVYEYRVVAFDNYGGFSAYSDILTVRVKNMPDTPYGLSAAVASHAERAGKKVYVYFTAHVFWMVSSYGDLIYEVERRKPGYNDFVKVASVPAHNPSVDGANDLDRLPGGTRKGDTYEYRVRAYNPYGYSPYSQLLTVKV
jgi:hypothetical protein